MRIRQLVADEATVVVWKSAFGLGILDHPGHAAMLFRSDLLPTIEATRAAERNHVEESLVRFTKMIDKLRERHRDEIDELARAIRMRDDPFMPRGVRDSSRNEVEEMQREFAPWLREIEQLEQQREARRAVLEENYKDPDYILWQYMDPSDIEQYAYVSWWPGNEGSFRHETGKGGFGRTGYKPKTDYRLDLTSEMSVETSSQRWEIDFCGKYKQLVKLATACTKSVDQYGIDHRNGAYVQLGMQCLKVMRSGAVRGIGQA